MKNCSPVGVREYVLRGKNTGADVTFPEEKDNAGGDFYCSHFGVEKPRVKFLFRHFYGNVKTTVGSPYQDPVQPG